MACSSGLLHPFVKMSFNSLGIAKQEILNLFTPWAVWLLDVRREKFNLRCAAVIRNVVILWLQYQSIDVWSFFLFIRPVLVAVSRTQGSSGVKSQIHCFGAGSSRPLAPFSSTCAIFLFALEPSLCYGAVSWLCPSISIQNHGVAGCEWLGIILYSQTFPHHLGLKTSHQRFIAFLFALYFLLSW